MKKRVLLTRSKEDNKYLRRILAPKGYSCIDLSLIEHINLTFNITVLEGFTDIIITSKRAADLLPVDEGVKNAWVVGAASADILKQKNYNIRHIAYSAHELINKIPTDIYNQTIYLSSNVISTEMPPTIKSINIYKIKYRNSLSEIEVEILKNGLDYILLYSENCAKTLIKLILENDLLKYIENSVIIAISSKVEKIVKGYLKETVTCNYPSQILDRLEDYDNIRTIKSN